MNAARTCSRRKIWSKMFLTDVVPAPDEPVMAMIGCLADMRRLLPDPERSLAPGMLIWFRP